jgi:hypothetical protein
MNGMEQLLQGDLNYLIDCVAATTHQGTVAGCAGEHPELASRLREAEARLSATRLGLLQAYTVWQELLRECRDLWALADLASESTMPGERYAA